MELARTVLKWAVSELNGDNTFRRYAAGAAPGRSAAIPVRRVRLPSSVRLGESEWTVRLMLLLGSHPDISDRWSEERLSENAVSDREPPRHTVHVLILLDRERPRDSSVVLVVGAVFSGICSLRHLREILRSARCRVPELLGVTSASVCVVCLEPPPDQETSCPYQCPHAMCLQHAADLVDSGRQDCPLCHALRDADGGIAFADSMVEASQRPEDVQPPESAEAGNRVAVSPDPVSLLAVGTDILFDEF